MPKVAKLVNRGPAGLLSKPASVNGIASTPPTVPKGKIDNIRCKGDIVPIGSLTLDPDNARLHPERNMESIRDSLNLYGQTVPLVVRRQTRVVIAGNGRLAAARDLGWTKVAVSFIDMTDAEAAGYGLADNRTSELARWDFEAVARLERLVAEAGGVAVGWTQEEILALRSGKSAEAPADFPEVDESLEIESVCPKCGYQFSGGEKRVKVDLDEEAEAR